MERAESEFGKARRQNRHWIFILLVVGLGITLLLTVTAGTGQTLALLANANPLFVSMVAVFQGLRYVAMTISTRTVAQIVGMPVPWGLMFQVTVAASAANRTFVGGAAGLVVRGAFFLKRGLHAGSFAGLEGIEDVVSLAAIAIMFVSGVAIVAASGNGGELRWDVLGLFAGGAIVLTAVVVLFLRHRDWVDRTAIRLTRGLNRLAGFGRKRRLTQERTLGAVEDFYRSLALASQDPVRVLIAFLCAFGRLACDWVALYFAFRAIGYEVPLGTVLLIFVVSSSVATIAAVPGQIGVYESSLALMSTAVGIPAPVAVSATILYRLIAFWLPIPFGFAFAWNLERRDLI